MSARPTTIGGIIACVDSADLALLSIDGLTVSTKVWNADVEAYFSLTVSTAALVTDEIVAVSGVTGFRWIIDVPATGVVDEIAPGNGVEVDNTDPHAPIVGVPSVDAWYDEQVAFIRSKIAGATMKFSPLMKLGTSLAGFTPTGAADASVVGGGATVGTSGTAFTPSIYQNVKAEKFGFSFRGKFALPTSGRSAAAGLWSLSGPGTHQVVFGTTHSVDATHFAFRLFGTGNVALPTSVLADTNLHDFCVTNDGTTLTLWIDGVSASTMTGANYANLVNGEANQLVGVNTNAGECILTSLVYGYEASLS
jgi:hypothetical protein